ncbi:hypothetical protein [Sphaerochaeta sp. PS]|uniref:hypothetical protein n=1 Tax=Sphaerochaeta sp. PS TaxID=3076336 RepID=UPI0028A45C93|nr:hypothetical protein [Sphaerochaeta sp. PS]MDT4763385.1 hypothetical protein [Sphaerochaeta sp. PS]
MSIRKVVYFLLILLLIAPSLSAAIEATYVPAPYLAFGLGTPPFSPTKLVSLLGTLTITATAGEPLYQPSLVNLQIDNTFQFTGPVTYYDDWQTGLPHWDQLSTNFYLAAVTTEFGNTSWKRLNGSGGIAPLTTSQNNLGVSVFVVKFYFYSDANASIYQPGGLYTKSSGTIGAFTVAVAATDHGIYYNYVPNIYVPVNGQTIPPGGAPPTNPPEFVPVGTPSLPYEDEDHPVNQVIYALSIIDQQPFTLSSGYGFATALIARTELSLTNALSSKVYGVDVQFTNLDNSSSFALHPDGYPSGYAIPYQLKFLNQTVVPGDPITWSPLVNGPNLQDILITGISPTTALAAPSGLFKDTIVVSVTPLDTI